MRDLLDSQLIREHDFAYVDNDLVVMLYEPIEEGEKGEINCYSWSEELLSVYID